MRGPACRSPNFATTLPRAAGPCSGRTATDAGTATTTSIQPPNFIDLLKDIDEDPLFHVLGIAAAPM